MKGSDRVKDSRLLTATELDAELFARTIRALCVDAYKGDGEDQTRPFRPLLWQELAEVGVWGLLSEEGGQVTDAVVAAEALGSEGFCGPVIQAFLWAASPLESTSVETGRQLPAVAEGDDRIVPWGAVADVVAVLGEGTIARASARRRTEMTVLGGEPWAEMELSHGQPVEATWACAVANVVAAAYGLGLGGRLLDITRSYVADRVQFGRPLLSFQTVEHRLARVTAELSVAADLVIVVARWMSEADRIGTTARDGAVCDWSTHAAGARLLASEVALQAGFVGHQLAGGMGFVAGTLLSALSSRAQSLRYQPPGPDAVSRAVLGGDRSRAEPSA